MKKLLIIFIIYYALGFILLNGFTVSRFLGSGDISYMGPKIIALNVSRPTFYGQALVWPLFVGIGVYCLTTEGCAS